MSTLLDKIGQIESLEYGKGTQYLLNEAYEILGNPIVMFDTDYSLIAYSEGVVTDDLLWNEIISNGTFLEKTRELFKEEGFTDAVSNAKTITFLQSDKLKYERILGKVFNKNGTHVANLVLKAFNRPFGTEDPVLLEAVCKVLSNEISTNDFFQNYERTYQDSLIRRLLDGSINDKVLYSAHVSVLYHGLKDNLYLAVVDVEKYDPEYTRLTYLKDLLIQKQPAFKYAIYSNHIIIILSSDNETINIKKDLNQLHRILKQKKLYAGISNSFGNLFELQKYYVNAIYALKNGLASNTRQRIFLYDEDNHK